MSNCKWVCFACREAVRRYGSAVDVRCPKCAKQCENIGYKIPVPPKSKPALWRELAVSYANARRRYFYRSAAANVRRIHDLEHEVARMESMEPNHGRLSLIKRLRADMASVKEKHQDLLAGRDCYLQGKLPPTKASAR
jgi:hypothetical protein